MTAVYGSRPEDGAKPAYPFAEWLNGNQWVLTRGRDWWGDPNDFITSLRASARARRLDVTVTVDSRQRCVYVRAAGQRTLKPRYVEPDGSSDA